MNIEKSIARKDFGSATSALFELLKCNRYDNIIESHLESAVIGLSTNLALQGHTPQALWIWNTLVSLLRGKSHRLVFLHAKYSFFTFLNQSNAVYLTLVFSLFCLLHFKDFYLYMDFYLKPAMHSEIVRWGHLMHIPYYLLNAWRIQKI